MNPPSEFQTISDHFSKIRGFLEETPSPNYEQTEQAIYATFDCLGTCTTIPPMIVADMKLELLTKLTICYIKTSHLAACRLILEHILHMVRNQRIPSLLDPSQIHYRTDLFSSFKALCLDLEMFDLAEQFVVLQQQSLPSDAWAALLANQGPDALRHTQQSLRVANLSARLSLGCARQKHDLLINRVCDLLNMA